MTDVGQLERRTQQRVVKLFREQLRRTPVILPPILTP